MKVIIYTRFLQWDLCIYTLQDKIAKVQFAQKNSQAIEAIEHDPFTTEVFRQLDEYLTNPNYNFNLKFELQGTTHQQKVWKELLKIAPGETKTYKEIASSIQSHPRAVGQACGSNQIVLLIPCHRIIKTDKSLGGFMQSAKNGFNLDIKRWLLQHEKAIS